VRPSPVLTTPRTVPGYPASPTRTGDIVPPSWNFIQLAHFYLAMTLSPLLPDDDQPTLREYLDMLGYGRAARVKILCDPVQVQRLPGKEIDNILLVGSAIA